MLFGKVNPSGRLPVTFYKDGEQPDITDYSMKNRTYRYYKGEALYPFGHGLSYTTFAYKLSGKTVSAEALAKQAVDYERFQTPYVELTVEVTNTGARDGEEAILAFVDKCPEEKNTNGRCDAEKLLNLDATNQPVKSLCAFGRVFLKAGETKSVSLNVSAWSLTTVLEDGERVFLPGEFAFMVHDQTVTLDIN